MRSATVAVVSTEAQTPQTEASPATRFHGGRLIARRLKAHGVTKLFTLSGGHLFSIYDGCREEGIDLVDVRHEMSAAFAAEGWAKVTREPGVCALTAGPGVTNGMSPLASAQQNNSPMVVLGGRAPQMRWGMGSLQEIDHVPFVTPLVKMARTAGQTDEIPGLVDEALRAAIAPHSGPTFVDFPLDVVFTEGIDPNAGASLPDPTAAPSADGGEIERAAALLKGAERPAIMAGTNLYWGRGRALRRPAGHPGRAVRGRRGRLRPLRLGRAPARCRGREAGGGARAARRRAGAAAPNARLSRAGRDARPQRRRDRRRRRLRLLRRPGGQLVRARMLARPRPV